MPELFTIAEGLLAVTGLIIAELVALIVLSSVLLFIISIAIKQLIKIAKPQAVTTRLQEGWRFIRFTIIVISFFSGIAIVALNAWIISLKKEPLAYSLDLIREIPPSAWWSFSLALLQIFSAIIVARYLVRGITWSCNKLQEKMLAIGKAYIQQEQLSAFFLGFSRLLTNATWMLVVIFSAKQLNLPDLLEILLLKAVYIYLIIGIGLIIVRAVAVIIPVIDTLTQHYSKDTPWFSYYQALSPLTPLLQRSLEYAIWIASATLVLAQLSPVAKFALYGPRLIQSIGIYFLAKVVIEAGYLAIDRRKILASADDDIAMRRHATITPLIKTMFRYLTYFIAGVMILASLGIEIMPFLAGAGILGVVIGFGAQPFINDIVNGFFILFENTYLVGDTIDTGGVLGTVSDIDFRTTRLRDPDGNLHIIRNGNINHVKNYSKEFTFAVVEIRTGYDIDVSKTQQLLEEAGKRLTQQLPEIVTDKLVVCGIVEFEEYAMRFKTTIAVKPGKHFAVATKLREIIKQVFDEADITMPPIPQRIILPPNNS